MLRHRPHGSGHPYAETGDQRVPAEPLHGDPVELRVRAAARVRGVACEWQPLDGQPVHLALTPPAEHGTDATDADGGHLAAAQARALADLQFWSVTTPPVSAATRYRFVAALDDGGTRRSRWYDVSPAHWVMAGHPDAGALVATGPVEPLDVEWLAGPDGTRRVRFALPLRPGEHVVGFGERYDAVDQRGRALDAVVFEQYKSQGRHARTYLPMPFGLVVGNSESWGFHVHTSRRSWYDVGRSTSDRLVVEVATGGERELRVSTWSGTPAGVLDAFLAEVGRPTELPDWVFRLWASGNEWNTQADVMTEMDRHRELDIPVGALVIEAWSDESTFTAFRDASYPIHEDGAPHRLADFTFPPDGAWPDPKGMVDELHDRDVKVLLWQIPLLKARPHPVGQQAADLRVARERGYLVREADGRPYRNRGWWFPLAPMPDLSSHEATEWWTSKRRYLVDELGIDGFKTDGGEHAWGHDLRYADGHRGDDGNNLYPVHYARAYGDLLRSCGKAPVTFSRAGFAGSQPHGAFWAGDEDSTWEAFRSSVTAGITASACGILYWGWDLAGFSGEVPEPELYLRATAASCFMPVMQYHSEFHHHRPPKRDRTPWNVAERTGDEGVVPVFRRYAHLRERLVPYLAAEAKHAIAQGEPLLRGLFFDHPDDPAIWAYPLQFGLGRSLLVNPVTSPGATEWESYLPRGDWVDAWTGERLVGGQAVVREVPLDRVPVFALADQWPHPQLAGVFED
jgi:alpha-glucosidase (family GH31 glycosyl hydrolase)